MRVMPSNQVCVLLPLQRHAGIEEDASDSSEDSEDEGMEIGEGEEGEGDDDDEEEGGEGRRHVMQCIQS